MQNVDIDERHPGRGMAGPHANVDAGPAATTPRWSPHRRDTSRQSGSSDHPALAHRPGALPRPLLDLRSLVGARGGRCGAASCGSSGSRPRQPWSCSRRASSPDEVTRSPCRPSDVPIRRTATTSTVYRRASGSVRKTLVDPVEHIAQSIAETAFAKAHEPRPLALTAQAPEVNGRHASYLGSLSFRDYPVTCGEESSTYLARPGLLRSDQDRSCKTIAQAEMRTVNTLPPYGFF